jgi:hypothetical protein
LKSVRQGDPQQRREDQGTSFRTSSWYLGAPQAVGRSAARRLYAAGIVDQHVQLRVAPGELRCQAADFRQCGQVRGQVIDVDAAG